MITIGEKDIINPCKIKTGIFKRGSPTIKQNPIITFLPIIKLSFFNKNKRIPIPTLTRPKFWRIIVTGIKALFETLKISLIITSLRKYKKIPCRKLMILNIKIEFLGFKMRLFFSKINYFKRIATYGLILFLSWFSWNWNRLVSFA